MKQKSKRILCIVLPVVFLSLVFIGLTRIIIFSNDNAVLTFVYGDTNIVQPLTEEETAEVKEILSGKNPYYFLLPSCGFDENISVSFGSQTFAVACDECNIVEDCRFGRFFDISQEERDYITSLFEKYGGYFPCN